MAIPESEKISFLFEFVVLIETEDLNLPGGLGLVRCQIWAAGPEARLLGWPRVCPRGQPDGPRSDLDHLTLLLNQACQDLETNLSPSPTLLAAHCLLTTPQD